MPLAAQLGQRSTVDVIQQLTAVSRREAGRRLRAARAVLGSVGCSPAFGRLAADDDAGIGADAIDAVIEPLGRPARVADAGLFAAALEQLVESARAGLPADLVREQATLWRAALDPDGIEPAEELAMEKRFFTVGRDNGGLAKVSGLLPTEHAASVRAVLDAYTNPRGKVAFAPSPADIPGERPAEAADAPADPRTAGQKRADALRDVFALFACRKGQPIGWQPTLTRIEAPASRPGPNTHIV